MMRFQTPSSETSTVVSLQPSVLPPLPVLNTLCSPCLCCPATFCLYVYWQRYVCPSTGPASHKKTVSLPPFPSFSFPSCLLTHLGAYFGREADHRSFLKRHLLRPSAHSHAGKHPRIHLKKKKKNRKSELFRTVSFLNQ